MGTQKILLIEDEQDLAEVLVDNLEAEGYDVVWASDGMQGREKWRKLQPTLVVLDVMMPEIDGLTLCRQMRDEGDRTPVLFLSARGQPEDRVQGLAMGGDDYMAKPFHLPEFLMRLHTMLRRVDWGHDEERQPLQLGEYLVDLGTGIASLADGRRIKLASDERKLLAFLAERPGQMISRDQLLDALWSDGVYPSTRAIERLMQRLRQHFEPLEPLPGQPRYFHRLPGVRFCFTPDGVTPDAAMPHQGETR